MKRVLISFVAFVFLSSQVFAQGMDTGSSRVSMDLGLLNKIVQYLGTQPYNEVNPLLVEIQKNAKVVMPEKKLEKKEAEKKPEKEKKDEKKAK